jgi:hypothetical protein
VYGLADITGSAAALATAAKAEEKESAKEKEQKDEQSSDAPPEPEPEPENDGSEQLAKVKVVEVSLVPEKSSSSAAVPPVRKGEEVTCDIMVDKRDAGQRFAGGISVVWTNGVVKSAPRATGGFGQVNAPDRDLKDLKFHWTEQLGEEARAVSIASLCSFLVFPCCSCRRCPRLHTCCRSLYGALSSCWHTLN